MIMAAFLGILDGPIDDLKEIDCYTSKVGGNAVRCKVIDNNVHADRF